MVPSPEWLGGERDESVCTGKLYLVLSRVSIQSTVEQLSKNT